MPKCVSSRLIRTMALSFCGIVMCIGGALWIFGCSPNAPSEKFMAKHETDMWLRDNLKAIRFEITDSGKYVLPGRKMYWIRYTVELETLKDGEYKFYVEDTGQMTNMYLKAGRTIVRKGISARFQKTKTGWESQGIE